MFELIYAVGPGLSYCISAKPTLDFFAQFDNVMQKIEAPTEEDIDSIARAIVHAQRVTTEVLGVEMDGTRGDLALIQRLLDTGTIERESTYTLQALGLAFGRAFVHENKAFDWWIVHDGHGRDPVLRYRDSSLLAFPKTMLSKRIRDGEPLDVVGLFDQLAEQLSQLIAQGYGGR
jgi:hypothetical protein